MSSVPPSVAVTTLPPPSVTGRLRGGPFPIIVPTLLRQRATVAVPTDQPRQVGFARLSLSPTTTFGLGREMQR